MDELIEDIKRWEHCDNPECNSDMDCNSCLKKQIERYGDKVRAKVEKEGEEVCRSCIYKVSKDDIDAISKIARQKLIEELIENLKPRLEWETFAREYKMAIRHCIEMLKMYKGS